MSRISDMEEQISNMYEQIKLMEDTLIKTKLQEGVKALKEKGELSDEESSDYIITDETILLRILDEQGIGKNGYCWISTDRHNHEYGYYIMKIDGDFISISPGGRLCMQSIESIKELLDEIAEDTWMYDSEDISRYIDTITNLMDIDLEHLKPKIQEKMPNEPEVTFEEDDYEYDDEHDEWDDNEYGDDLDPTGEIYRLLRNNFSLAFDEQVAINLNSINLERLKKYFKLYPETIELFEDMRRKYPDIVKSLIEREAEEHSRGDEFVDNMKDIWWTLKYYSPEEVATKLNSMSIEYLKEYFELYPGHIALFEEIRSKYPDIKSLAEREAEEHSSGDEFVANIVDYATKKVEVRDKNAQAAQLAQDYKQQLPANEQSLDDE